MSKYYRKAKSNDNVSIELRVTPVEVDDIPRPYRANFLWGHKDESIEEAGYEFANGKTEDYIKEWWGILLQRAQSDPWHPASEPPKPEDFEPTGKVMIIDVVTESALLVTPERYSKFNVTHWKKVTPPK